ncbi:MAG: YciI family protein [Acidimicrobiales bacterium]
MAQYLLSVHGVEGQPDPDPATMQEMFEAVDAFNQKYIGTDTWVFAGGLHPPATATVVTSDGVDVTMTDGPFSEAKEQIGGFWILEAADLDAALALAADASAACRAPVEVRPFQDEPPAA